MDRSPHFTAGKTEAQRREETGLTTALPLLLEPGCSHLLSTYRVLYRHHGTQTLHEPQEKSLFLSALIWVN